jgi:hypothetical protein
VPTVPFPLQSYSYLAQEIRRGGDDFRVFTVYVASSTTGAVKAFYASMMPQQVDLTGEVRWEQTASIPYDGVNFDPCADPYCWWAHVDGAAWAYFTSLEQAQQIGASMTLRLRVIADSDAIP